MSKRASNRYASEIGSLLEQILAGKGLDKKLRQYRAWSVWDEVVGPQIAQNAQPLRIRESTLEVRVANAAWMQQLQLLKPKILKELNSRLGEESLTDIYWRRGEIEPNSMKKPAEEAPPPQLTPDQAREIERLTSGMEDPELQRHLKKVLTAAGRHERKNESE